MEIQLDLLYKISNDYNLDFHELVTRYLGDLFHVEPEVPVVNRKATAKADEDTNLVDIIRHINDKTTNGQKIKTHRHLCVHCIYQR